MRTCVLGVVLLAACARAITRDQLYPYGSGLDRQLQRGAVVESPEVRLRVPVVFYGETYDSIFVNNHGILSFRADISSFMNAEFPLPYPSIAAFYSNVDTSTSGAVYYRESNENRVLAKATESVQNNFHDFYDFQPTSVFIVTWADVSYTGALGNQKNTYQAAIISNGNESFVELLYPDGDIQWIQRETSPDSLPDAKAQAGFVSEDGQMLLLRGSGSHQIRNIISWSNTQEPGKYVYRVGNVMQDGNVVVPDLYNQSEEESEEESRTCAQSGPSVCHIKARCVDYQAGICCQCNEGYYGNGKSCVKEDVPLRVHGKLNGVVNDVSLNDVDIQAYVVVADGRSYTALSQTPAALGNNLQLVHVLGGVIGWLFAKPLGDASNGYQLTGGVFNHTVDIFFPATNNRVTITQEFLGHDVFDQITLDCDIRGSLPNVGLGAKLQVTEYEEQYTVIEAGLIRSESTRTIIDKLTGVSYEQRIQQTIKYNTCHNAPPEGTVSSTLKVSKNYLGYEPKNNIVRYGMSNKIVLLGQEDPCIFGRSTCGPHSSCVVQGSSFACICESGFSNVIQDDALVCIDIDECAASTDNCDTNADCYNHDGGFQCRCRDGFEGNGVSCSRISQCREQSCNQFASCIEGYGGEATCVCNPGYTGDGQRCWLISAYTCDVLHNCSPYASCIFSQVSNSHICQCKHGYVGDGYYCSVDTQTHPGTLPPITTTPQPSTNYPDNEYLTHGYNHNYNQGTDNNEYNNNQETNNNEYNNNQEAGNNEYGNNQETSNNEYGNNQGTGNNEYGNNHGPDNNEYGNNQETGNNESENVQQFVLPNCGFFGLGCTCPEGYSSFLDEKNNELCRLDGYADPHLLQKNNDTSIACTTDSNCPPNAECKFTLDIDGQYVSRCVCPEGFVGNSYECVEQRSEVCACGPNAHCYQTANGPTCVCDVRYHGDGYICRPKLVCTNSSECESHAECRPDGASNEYFCQCIEGYIKDENEACIPDRQLCNGGVCAEHASCLYDKTLEIGYCACDAGYEGDGIYECIPRVNGQDRPYENTITTCDVMQDCNENAQCTQTADLSYHCVCREGYTGDGYDCRPEPSCRNDPYMCDVHASCLKRNQEYVCECNSGYSEVAYGNETRCELNPRQAGNFLVASDGVFVYRVPFKTTAWEYATPINSAIDQIAVGIDTDCQAGKVYWGDVVSNSIKRASYDGSAFELFLTSGIKSPEGVAIDWASRNIFWTDSKKLTIEVANVDTKVRKVLFSADIRNPRGIAVHPRRGKVFWTDWNRSNPKIEWANMDGSQRGVFVDNSDVKLPNSLAIDWLRDRLCYTDAGLFLIKCVNLDTMETETIVTNCLHPFGLAINQETFYWTDWKTLKIENIDTLTQKKGQLSIATAANKLYGVAVAPNECPGATNVCALRNGNCEADQLCLPDGRGGRTCVAGEQIYGY
ncbi:nidogen [Cydia fagiglandana]|uniref:nidogen n=1 Tax=Cydia fagiglandana TaxID=1458189 RepID=UPI002FEE22DA